MMSNIINNAITRLSYRNNVKDYSMTCMKKTLNPKQQATCHSLAEKIIKGQQKMIRHINEAEEQAKRERQEARRQVQENVKRNPYSYATLT